MAVRIIFPEFEMDATAEPDNATDYVYPTGDSDYCYDDEWNQWTFRDAFQTAFLSLVFLIGVVGNGLVVAVLLRRWRLLRITDIYLLHLALADLMLLLTFPFDLAEKASGWLFGDVLCKLTGLGKHLNLLCGSFLLACIGFDRYLAIVHAVTSMQSRRRRWAHLTCLALWLLCLALSMPNVVFLTVNEEEVTQQLSASSCFFNHYGIHANNWVLTTRVLDHVCFFLPLAAMSYCYAAVVLTLFRSQKSQAKQGAIRLSLLITLIFCVCWLPYNLVLLVTTMADLKVIRYESCGSAFQLERALDVSKALGYSHCCINPFLYAFVGVRFRNELRRLLSELGCGCACEPSSRTGHSRSSVSEGVPTNSTIM